jgi:methylmalonyl-CoA/ethylmalonyl-CoA epimerase
MPSIDFDHVAVALHSVQAALPLYRDALGGEYLMGGDSTDHSFRWVQFRFPGGGKIELLEPLGEGFLTRFLERRGEGLHHVTFKTDDVAASILELEGRGYEVVDVDLDDPNWKEAFLRPSKAHGTLIQVAWSSEPDDVAATRMRPPEIDDLLA